MTFTRKALDQGWQFKQETSLNNATAKDFLSVAQFPTVAHIDLLHHGLIKDPYIDMNELETLWVNDADWTYRTTFPAPASSEDNSRTALFFEGLDTVVTVFLNGQAILESKNMHISHHVDITDHLKPENTLELKFKNAPEYAKKEMARIGYKGNETDVHFGGPERLFLRKAQYHWGWDWGPTANTSGPWKEIWLETYVAKIEEMVVRQEVSADLGSAKVSVAGKVIGAAPDLKVVISLLDPSGEQVAEQEVSASKEATFSSVLEVSKDLQLWYPFTYGASPLYTVKVSLPNQDEKSQKLGLRRLRLLQHALKKEPGSSFVFEINNIRVFSGGSCWIPGDYMLPRFTRERYEEWLLLAKAGNQTMIRVWGGGIVESDIFYEICDREGILVWQDFLFACGNYPASDDYVKEITIEAEQQVKRVGYHASLVIWAGNNEDYMVAERRGWEYDMKDQEGPWDKTDFPARKIYERVLPEICERLAGDVPYWRSSPYGGASANDTTVGDTHIWDVWHGPMSPYQDYKAYTSRFVSEFGFESAPNIRTLHKAITTPSERHWQSRTFDAHDKGPGHQRRYPLYAGENFRYRMNPLSAFVYSTQFLQAEAMSYAYNHWRREFRGPGEENCSGILVWQLNDIWPGTSWALVDVDLHRKASYYITKRALAKAVVGMERVVTKQPSYIVSGFLPEKGALEVWAVNGFVTELEAVLKLSAFDIETGAVVPLPDADAERTVRLLPNQSNEITRIAIPNAEQTVVVAYLDSPAGERLARWVSWPEPLKFVRFRPDLKVTVTVEGDDVLLSTNAPAKGVIVEVPLGEGADAVFEDNFIDVVPGEVVRIKSSGLKGRKVGAKWLCDWEAEEGFEL